ncbi:uncharacterized protein LOC112603140 [Melanaphis sacchari]|uniref:uncharacterized protein LOC112603140 n=1 Tax=Melanaphis sacchari TaxID=742174 RepID=UPI000DC1590C|nr:uncharacterized protein LOC112603140 [Melanaphis sacchari]
MLFAFMLASALAATTAVLGRSIEPSPALQMTLVEENQIESQYEETGQILATDDRSSNLKYVMAIQSSSIWTEIKKRSLTINAPQGLNDVAIDKSLENLSDEELALLKQVCHDGLKCVAVDQLLVLYSVREPLGDGKLSVRTVITKITEVITKYTDEYHEDVYEYEAVTQSDDSSKVYESVTTIVEDNKELCQIDIGAVAVAAAVECYFEEVDGGGSVDTRSAVPPVVNNDVTVNYNEVENYNVNNDTVNIASIKAPPTSDGVVVTLGTDDPAENRSPDRRYVDGAVSGTSTGNETATTVKPVSTADGRQTSAGRPPPTADGVSGDRGDRWRRPEDFDRKSAPSGSDVGKNNETTVKNAAENGHAESNSDVVIAGSQDDASVRKGYVANGTLNNGNMVEYDINNGTINTGNIEGSTADSGIINVGTVNNGPVNYGTYDKLTNNGSLVALNGNDVQKYLSSVDNMYSTILERLG